MRGVPIQGAAINGLGKQAILKVAVETLMVVTYNQRSWLKSAIREIFKGKAINKDVIRRSLGVGRDSHFGEDLWDILPETLNQSSLRGA